MASPAGHALVGLTVAAVSSNITGTAPSPQLWLGAFIASGVPDLDVVLGLWGLKGPRYHRNASHSLILLLLAVAVGWGILSLVPISVGSGLSIAWVSALFAHPILDLVCTGSEEADDGFGIALFWPVTRRRFFVSKPIFRTADFGEGVAMKRVLVGIGPELRVLVPLCVPVFILAMVWR